MTDRPDSTDPDATDRTEGTARPKPAAPGSVVDMRDATPVVRPGPDTPADRGAQPTVDSSLVGEGGLPAMERRADQAPLRLGTPTVPGGARDETDAEAPIRRPDTRPADPVAAKVAPKPIPPQPEPKSDPKPTEPRPVPTVTSAPTARPVAPAPQRSGFAPLFLGGLVAAGLGAGAAWWAIPRLPAAWQPTAAAPAVDTAALNQAATAAARAEVERQTAALETRAVEAARQAAAAAADAASRASGASLAAQGDGLIEQARQAGADAAAKLIAEAPASAAQPDGTLQTTLAAQARQLAALDEKIAQIGQAPAAEAPAVDLATLQAQVESLARRPTLDPAAAERLSQLAADAEAATARINAAADQAEARLKDAEARAAQLTAAADEAARRARAAAAAASIGEAIQTGQPRTQGLAQLQEAGVEPPAALTADIPTLGQLADEFPAAARAALRADLRTNAAQGQGSLIGNFLRAQTGARSVTPREGGTADAVLSRAGDAVQRGAVAQALTELQALPEAARPAMADWTARARAYAEAQAALGTLSGAAPANPAATPSAAPAPSD
ncbi:COG4223 family protein, partial [Paracoccus sphaerophysae]|uniref:COG4223 family protein n=1 Tax=Paracoccus sphaerophysae TaxID=690417 RepID=UPI00068A7A10